jgi:hypothetical protein
MNRTRFISGSQTLLSGLSSCGTLLLSSSVAGLSVFSIRTDARAGSEVDDLCIAGALLVAFVGVIESINLAYPYYSLNQRLTHGSARWSTIAELKAKGLAHRAGKPLPRGAVRIGRLSSL